LSGYRLAQVSVPDVLLPNIKKILMQLKVGDVFSRKKIIDVTKQVGDALANHGYAFPEVSPIPQLDQSAHTVFLNFNITAGRRVYVRNIHVVGDTRTSGIVIRSQLRQMEGSLYSLKDTKESERRIKNLGYLDHVEISTAAVPSDNNQVDLTYHVHEVILYGASISEPNFMGSGKFVSVGFQRSEFSSSYGFTYTNPFYTTTGISRSFNFYYTHTTPGNVNIEPYTLDNYGSSMTYGIPISEFDSWNVGGGYDHTAVSNINPSLVSPSVMQFVSRHPSPYNQFKLINSISHSTLDRAIFPTSGNEQNLGLTVGVPVLHTSLPYYEAQYNGSLGYGGGYGDVNSLPFFENFYAGGLATLPGYEANTLGPKNPANPTESIGGNVEVLGGVNLILPNFISSKVRTGILLDAGNIFQTDRVPGIAYESINPKNLRVTTGIMVSWWSPLGAPLNFSLAVPLNKKPGDQLALFGFSFGATI